MAALKKLEKELKSLEKDLQDEQEQLDQVNDSLEKVPEDVALLGLKDDVLSLMAQTNKEIEKKQADIAAIKPAATPQDPPPPPAEEKWSKEKHPAFQPGYRRPGAPPTPPPPPEPQAPVTFSVNDTVMAKWVSGDKGFYAARITSVTGSSANPIYSVTFQGYGNTDDVRKGDLKPMDHKKRKAESSSTSSTSNTNSSGVISAAANVNASLANQKKPEPSKVSDGPPRPPKIAKKVKANKELEAGKSKWQEFAAKKGKMGKSVQKDSMFRTGEGVNARVGFIGSGQAMRKDPTKSKNVYTFPDLDE